MTTETTGNDESHLNETRMIAAKLAQMLRTMIDAGLHPDAVADGAVCASLSLKLSIAGHATLARHLDELARSIAAQAEASRARAH